MTLDLSISSKQQSAQELDVFFAENQNSSAIITTQEYEQFQGDCKNLRHLADDPAPFNRTFRIIMLRGRQTRLWNGTKVDQACTALFDNMTTYIPKVPKPGEIRPFLSIWSVASVNGLTNQISAKLSPDFPQVIQSLIVQYIDLADLVPQPLPAEQQDLAAQQQLLPSAEQDLSTRQQDAWSYMDPIDSWSPYCSEKRLH